MTEWKVDHSLIAYPDAVDFMEQRVEAISQGQAPELIWLLEHPPLYTLGTSGTTDDILDPSIPSFRSGRGGKVTYHGPGQRIVYCMLNLKQRMKEQGSIDIKKFVHDLEAWIIMTLEDLGIWAQRRQERIGLWVEEDRPYASSKNHIPQKNITPKEKKIAAIGLRIRQGISYHGIAINVHPDLDAFKGIVPCGLNTYGVTSIEKIKKNMASFEELDKALRKNFVKIFPPLKGKETI